MTSELSSCLRLRLLKFLLQSTHQLEVSPMVKYSALSLFADRFYPSLSRQRSGTGNWLLRHMSESNLQLFALISIWTSSKIHDSHPLSVKSLKFLGDKTITEQHFTTRDFLEAIFAGGGLHAVVVKVLEFEIGTSNIAFVYLEELLSQFVAVARIGDLVNFEACMDIMDLLYEKEETSTLYRSPRSLAASILVSSYVITVPKQRWEFPVLPWVKFVTSCKEEEIIEVVRDIVQHVFESSALV